MGLKPVSVIEARLGLQPNGRVQKFFTQTCAIHMDKYVPMDTGALAETTIIENQPTGNVLDDKIIYSTPYAHYVWNGVSRKGLPLNYQTDKHSKATDHWEKKMWSAEGKEIIKEVQNYIRSGKSGL